MDLVYLLQQTKSDEEIKALIDDIIKTLTDISNLTNNYNNVIGAKININPEFHVLRDVSEKYIQVYNGYYIGFIPKGTKLVYGTMNDFEHISQCNAGQYYYIDDFYML